MIITALPYLASLMISIFLFGALRTSLVGIRPNSGLTSSPVEAWRVVNEHAVPLTAVMPTEGFMLSVAPEPADDDWSGFDQALIDYENAMLERRYGHFGESVDQRIMRWCREGVEGDGALREARAEVRRAGSETWDAPSRELPMVALR